MSPGSANEAQIRNTLVNRLNRIVQKLPNGLLHRLVEDAQFFHDWNVGKKRARASSRMTQYKKRLDRSRGREA